jgi:hypothetical protein
MLLVWISGRPFSLFNVFLSALFVIAGIISINADRQPEKFGAPRFILSKGRSDREIPDVSPLSEVNPGENAEDYFAFGCEL